MHTIYITIICALLLTIWRQHTRNLDPQFCKGQLEFATRYKKASEEHSRLTAEIDRQYREQIKEAKAKRFTPKRIQDTDLFSKKSND